MSVAAGSSETIRTPASLVGMWRVLGILALIWIGFMVIGAVFKALVWVLVIGGVLFIGSAAYTALSKNDRKELR